MLTIIEYIGNSAGSRAIVSRGRRRRRRALPPPARVDLEPVPVVSLAVSLDSLGMSDVELDGDVAALLREFPALAREANGRVRCTLTGHVMTAKPEVVRPYVEGKKFAAALAKDKELAGLKEFEPHIVRSKYHPGKLFCRITGRYLQAKESAVVQHSSGRRFERGVEMLTRGDAPGAKKKLLVERPPEEVEEEKKEKLEKERAKAEEAREAKAKAREAKAKARVPATGPRDASDGAASADDPAKAAARERLRVNGGFSEELGCWVPPAHIIDSDKDEDEDSDSDEDEDDSDADSSEGDSDSSDSGEEGASSEDDVLMPSVRAPNFAKIMAKVKRSGAKPGVVTARAPRGVVEREPKAETGAGGGGGGGGGPRGGEEDDAFDWGGDARGGGQKRSAGKARGPARAKRGKIA